MLAFSHCLAENIDLISRDLVPYLASVCHEDIHYDPELEIAVRVEQILSGDIQLSWLCGLLYTLLKSKSGFRAEPVAVPRFSGQSRPVYSSYIVVHKDSPYTTLDDLDKKRLVINEKDSLSGHHMLRYYLRTSALRFELLESGGHVNSLEMIAAKQADIATIDSTVFAYLKRQKPQALKDIKAIGLLDDFPAPPLVVHEHVPQKQKDALRRALLDLPQRPEGKMLLDRHGLCAFEAVDDVSYDPVRTAYKEGRDLNKRSVA